MEKMELDLDFNRLDLAAVETFVTENAQAMPEYAASSATGAGGSCAANACSCSPD